MSEHIPDLELSLLAHDPGSFTRERTMEIERHTAGCAQCGASLDFYVVAEEDLRDPEIWESPGEKTRAVMRAYAERCAAEDAEADKLLKPYLENATKAAWTDVRRQRELHTGGVVRRLNALAHATVANKPREALIFADLAQAVASMLPDDLYPGKAVYELRGTAWKELANALLRTGKPNEALESLRRAARAYENLGSSTNGLAAVELVRAAAYYQLGELAQAAVHAENAERKYTQLGLERPRMKALLQRGQIKYEALEFESAAAIFRRLMDYGEEIGDPVWTARGAYCRAACDLERGKVADAAMLFHMALVVFRETGPESERISTEWGLARVVLHGGNPSLAAGRLRDVMTQFEELGMLSDAALAGVDLSEALLALGRLPEIVEVAAHAFKVLKKAGILTAALTALAYLKEAAAQGRVNSKMLKELRLFLRRVEREPDLLFIPPA